MHLSDGSLRRLLDEPQAFAFTDRRHAERCLVCRTRQAAIAADAEWAGRLLASADGPDALDTEAALARFEAARGGAADGPPGLSPWRRWPRLTAGAAAAAAAAALVVYGPVGSYASQLLTVFQPVEVAPVSVPTHALRGLGRLSDYGDVTLPQLVFRTVASDSAAAAASGLALALPTALPGSLGAPRFAVLPQGSVDFTFLASKAAATARRKGLALPPMPPSLDHSTLSVTLGPAAVAVYAAPGPVAGQASTSGRGSSGAAGGSALNALYVAVAQAPVVRSNGANAATIENYLLSLPGIPASLATELRALEGPTQTLPLPIPQGQANATDITLGSTPAVEIATQSGVYNAVVWEAAGRIHAVAGPFTAAQVEAAARSVAAQG